MTEDETCWLGRVQLDQCFHADGRATFRRTAAAPAVQHFQHLTDSK